MTAAESFDSLLARLQFQHERFLADATSKTFQALRLENARLAEENARLHGRLCQQQPRLAGKVPTSSASSPANEEQLLPPFQKRPSAPGLPRPAENAAGLGDSSLRQLATAAEAAAADDGSAAAAADVVELPGAVVQAHDGKAAEAEAGAAGQRPPVRHVESTRAPPVVGPADKQRSKESTRAPPVVGPADKQRSKERRRLRELFQLCSDQDFVSSHDLQAVVATRTTTPPKNALDEVLVELKMARKLLAAGSAAGDDDNAAGSDKISVEALLDLLQAPDLFDVVRKELVEDVYIVVQAVGTQTVDELIDEATRGSTNERKTRTGAGPKLRWEKPLTVAVSAAVIVSLLGMGLSLDATNPDSWPWLALEVACTLIFIVEAVLKIRAWRWDYFRGELGYWNMSDLAITLISVCELLFTIVRLSSSDEFLGGKIASAARATVTLRALRMARAARLMKLIHSPLLRDFANMMVGFMIGIPSLFWVLLLFLVTVYMIGLVFRQAFGPAPDQNLTAVCAEGDDLGTFDADCPVHYLYGEEFFGSVPTSMFTAFRFMLGDYSTRGGKSLVVAFSVGYGYAFDVIFVAWMIVVLFGLFNIITAIFVDSTISGLKTNDLRRKYAQQYEREYVRRKLKSLLSRIMDLHRDFEEPHQCNRLSSTMSASYTVGKVATFELQIGEDEFVEVMEDPEVNMLLEDLDIAMFNPAGLFHTFDPDGDGTVSLHELVQAVMKLRGEPQKGDIIAAWASLRALHNKIDAFSALFAQSAKQRPSGAARGAAPELWPPEAEVAHFSVLPPSVPALSGTWT